MTLVTSRRLGKLGEGRGPLRGGKDGGVLWPDPVRESVDEARIGWVRFPAQVQIRGVSLTSLTAVPSCRLSLPGTAARAMDRPQLRTQHPLLLLERAHHLDQRVLRGEVGLAETVDAPQRSTDALAKRWDAPSTIPNMSSPTAAKNTIRPAMASHGVHSLSPARSSW